MTMTMTLLSQAKLVFPLQPLFFFSFIHPLAGAVELEVDAAIIEEKKLDLASCILPASTLGSAGVLSISPLFPSP